MGRNWRTTGLATTMFVLLVLAACGGAVSSVQQSARHPTALQHEKEPSDTAVLPAGAEAPDTADPAATAELAGRADPTATDVPSAASEVAEQEYEIVTLLPPDAIPAIDEPRFYGVREAEAEYHAQELVIGVEVDGQARAYPVGLLSRHEIVNDTVAGHPIAVTW
jgi:hypothetical protein